MAEDPPTQSEAEDEADSAEQARLEADAAADKAHIAQQQAERFAQDAKLEVFGQGKPLDLYSLSYITAEEQSVAAAESKSRDQSADALDAENKERTAEKLANQTDPDEA